MTRYSHLSSADFNRLDGLENHWLSEHPELRSMRRYYGWDPYPLHRFRQFLDLAIQHMPAPTFLDAGCGIGTKCALAAAYGLKAEGIELFDDYADQAEKLGITVHRTDVRDFPRYDSYGIVYVNCPMRADNWEASFERLVQDKMSSGCVLIQVNQAAPPDGWEPLLNDPGKFRGVWVKP